MRNIRKTLALSNVLCSTMAGHDRTSKGFAMKHAARWMMGVGCVAAIMTATPSQAASPVFFQGSAYEYVPTYTTWNGALAEAASMNFMGFPGRLATITSAAENDFIASLVPYGGNTMLGGSDARTEGTWVWETGPEAGTIFWKDGAPYGSAYTNWRPGEPNHYFASEDYLVMSRGQWNDSPANDFLHSGYVVEYRLTASGFDFGMTNAHAGAIRNVSPSDRLVRLDITLPGDSFFDSATTLPGQEFAAWSVVAVSPGVSWALPNSAATDGQRTATLYPDLAPTEALHFQVDIDRLSGSDGDGFAPGTLVKAYFSDGDVEYSLTGVVQAGEMSILDTTFPYSVRTIAAVPEPAEALLLCAGLMVIAAARWRDGARGSLTGRSLVTASS